MQFERELMKSTMTVVRAIIKTLIVSLIATLALKIEVNFIHVVILYTLFYIETHINRADILLAKTVEIEDI